MCEILKIFALTYTHLHACCPQTSWHTVCYQEGLLKEPSLALCCRTAGTVLDKEMEAESSRNTDCWMNKLCSTRGYKHAVAKAFVHTWVRRANNAPAQSISAAAENCRALPSTPSPVPSLSASTAPEVLAATHSVPRCKHMDGGKRGCQLCQHSHGNDVIHHHGVPMQVLSWAAPLQTPGHPKRVRSSVPNLSKYLFTLESQNS